MAADIPTFEGTFDAHIGYEIHALTPDEVRASVAVRDDLRQPAGLVHGGVYASMAESLASAATWLAVVDEGKAPVGMSNNTTFLRPITAGTIHASGRPLHRGRTTWVWDLEFRDDDDRVCAVTRVTIAVRDARPAS